MAKDSNHAEIVRSLRAAGYTVVETPGRPVMVRPGVWKQSGMTPGAPEVWVRDERSAASWPPWVWVGFEIKAITRSATGVIRRGTKTKAQRKTEYGRIVYSAAEAIEALEALDQLLDDGN